MKCEVKSLILLLLSCSHCYSAANNCCNRTHNTDNTHKRSSNENGTSQPSAVADTAVLAALLSGYFRYHGVHSLTLIICSRDVATMSQQQRLQRLTQLLVADGFYVRIFGGEDYVGDQFAAPTSTAAFEPSHSFRTDNATRRPLRLQMPPLSHKTGILMLHVHSACALNVLRWSAAPEHNYFTTGRFWLLLTKASEHLAALQDEDIFFPPDSEVRIMCHPPAAISPFSLIDVYKVAVAKPLKQRLVAAQLHDVRDMLAALQRFGSAISYRKDLEGITFKSGLVIAFPESFTYIEDPALRHIDTMAKANTRLIYDLALNLNMSFSTTQMDNFGWIQPNGSFGGLMGRFQRYELDFARHAILMRMDRLSVSDFVAETYRIRAGFMFRQPSLSTVANIFTMPFEKDVWLAIIILIVITSLVFTLDLIFSPYRHNMHFLDCFIFVWGAMCQQGFFVTVGNRSARIIVFTTFMAALFLFTSFSANIVALLQSPSEAIRSLSDLDQSPLELGVQDTQYNRVFLFETTNAVTRRLVRKKIAPKGESVYLTPRIGMAKVRTGMFAFQVELHAGYQIISETYNEPEKCGLKELVPFQMPMTAVPTRKNFPYRELFRRQLRWQREVGLINREQHRWFPQKPKCESGVVGITSIGLTESRYAFATFGLGILLGVIMFGFESITKTAVDVYFKSKTVI